MGKAGLSYFVPFGFLKIIEFITSLVAWALMANFLQTIKEEMKGLYETSGRDRDVFLLAVCIVAMLFTIIWFLLNVCGVMMKCRLETRHILFSLVHLLIGVVVIVSGSIIANWAHDKKIGHTAHKKTKWVPLDKYKASAAFGILTGIVLVIDGLLHLCLGARVYNTSPSGA